MVICLWIRTYPVCNCQLISLLALVIVIRVGGLLLQVMSVQSISSSVTFDMILFVAFYLDFGMLCLVSSIVALSTI